MQSHLLLVIFLGICFISVVVAQDKGYCDPKLCTDPWGRVKPHIGCPGVAKNECPKDAQWIAIEKDLRDMVLDKHNSYRNQLAAGKLAGFSPARQMPTVQWDDELAYLAYLNAMQCNFDHDECHNTYKYKWSGQNLGWSNGYSSDKQAVQINVDGWWAENKNATKSDIDKVGNSRYMIGHFTAMAQDRTDRIGCAGSRYNGKERVLACNYSFTNLQGSAVYKTGSSASGCKTGTNSKYPSLCSTSESVNPNP